jgi:hypothetical protein
MNAWFAPALAAIDPGMLKLIFFAVVTIIYVFNHFVGKGQQRKPPRPDPRLRPQAPGRQEVNDEVAEFLRRTAERTNAKKPPVEAEPAPIERRPLVERRLPSTSLSGETVEVEAIDEPPSGAGVAAHVQQHLDTREFAQRASQLGQVEQEERSFQAHVQQTFDHQVGQLASRRSEPAVGTGEASGQPTAAESVAALLADSQNLRSAVVLNEILQRPTDRW